MNDERRDDEILGRALARAIETIDVNQTPFEKSRVASAPARRGFSLWQFGAAAAAVVLALALGAWFTRPTEGQPGVAASPSVPVATSTPGTTATPAATIPSDRIWVYFARDGLPPVGGFALGTFDNRRPESAIGSRLSALRSAKTGIPAGATNAFSEPTPTQSGSSTFGMSIKVQGDLATVEFDLSNGWGVRGSAQSLALLQQLVYTITEEPGVNRALITEKGKPSAVIDQLVVDKPLSREEVSGYGVSQASGPASTITSGGTRTAGLTVATSYSVDSVAPGVARFVVTLTGPGGAAAALPPFTAYLDRTEQPNFGKASIYLEVMTEPNPTGLTVVDRSPLRAIRAVTGFGSPTQVGGAAFVLGLDDARPWRVFTLANPTRIVVDIGGAPQATSDRVAVYQPTPSTTIDSRISRTFTVSGAARVFEANVSWRLKDSSGREAASGHFLASLGSSAVWGTFDTRIAIPASVNGNVTLELFEASAKDGTPQGVVQIPLAVR